MIRENIPSHQDWHDATEAVVLPNGIKMAYMEVGNPAGPTLVLIHGFSDSSRVWRSMMLELQHDYHMYAIDLRGFGQSDKPQQFVYTMAEHAADVVAFMDEKEIKETFVMGHSMGSMIAQNVAFSDPDRVRGVALLATFTHMHETPEDVREIRDFYASLDIPALTDEELLKSFIPEPESLQDQTFVQGYLSTLKGLSGKGLSAAWFGMSMADNRNFLQFIKAPVFVAWGSKDAIFTKEYQEELRQYLPHAKYEDYIGIAHEIPTEIPDRVAPAVNGFFKSITNR